MIKEKEAREVRREVTRRANKEKSSESNLKDVGR
jgi:hypothetical protein